MALRECRLCGRVFTEENSNYCRDCIRELGELYGSVHEYMRDHNDEDFDIEKLSEEMGVNPAYIKALVDLGYISSIIKEDEMDQDQRKRLASAFGQELGKMRKNKIMFYGGEIYSRKKS